MNPQISNENGTDELRDLARKIREYQVSLKLSDNALLKKFAGLGSTKTFKKILDGDFTELDLENQFNNYRSVWAFIESLGNDTDSTEDLYDDLWPVIQLKRVFFETRKETGIARFVIMSGPTGSGKSSARRVLMEKFGASMLCVEAREDWNGKPNPFLAAIIKAFGKKEMSPVACERFDKAAELLRTSRRCLMIEEAHHLGPRNFNVVKSLINNTPGEFVLLGNDTLLKRLEMAAYEDASQLTGNRLAERINLGKETRERDARIMIERRINFANGDLHKAVKLCVDKANNYGRLAFVRDVCIRAARKADGGPVTMELFVDAVREEVASR